MNKEVIIYSSNTCSVCKAAKNYFNENNIDYEERNIDKNPEYTQFLIDNGYRGVPVIIIDGQQLLGFDRQKVEQLLS